MASLVALDSVASSYTLPDGADKLLPSSVVSMISPACQETGLPKLLSVLLLSVQTIGENLRNASYTSVAVGSTNLFGDNQLDVDVKTDAVVFQNLQASGLVALASSEEQPTYVECGGENFSVGFDPLDGSSIIGANFAVGTILGIYPGRGFVDRTGRDQVAAMISTYGPRMSVALALSSTATVDGQPITLELTYSSTGWFVSVAKMVIHPTCKTFAPGNLRATADNPAYRALVNYWITSKYTLRYSGGLVPDVYHILIKQGGVLSNASSPQAKALTPTRRGDPARRSIIFCACPIPGKDHCPEVPIKLSCPIWGRRLPLYCPTYNVTCTRPHPLSLRLPLSLAWTPGDQ